MDIRNVCKFDGLDVRIFFKNSDSSLHGIVSGIETETNLFFLGEAMIDSENVSHIIPKDGGRKE